MPAIRTDYQLADPAQLFPGTILIAAPHMDDEVLACGGTIARLPDRARVHLVYATDGSQSYTPVVPWLDATSRDLSSVRRAEAKSALETLGVSPDNLHFLDFPDGKLAHHAEALERSLTDLVRKLRPDHVLIPFRYDRHPDHLAVNRAAHSALQREGGRAQLFEYFVYYRWRMLPGRDVRTYVRGDQLLAVDVEPVARQKRTALDCFRSQTTQYYPWQDRPILSRSSLDEVCRHPEVFLRYDPAFEGVAVFTGARAWIRFVHSFEPMAKRRKDQVMALIRRGRAGMPEERADLGRPIRVVLFCGGPTLDRAVVRFVSRLESESEIEFVGGFCQTHGQSLAAVIRDRLRRRGLLGPALLLAEALQGIVRVLAHPRAEMALWRSRAGIADRIHAVPDLHAESVLERVRALDADLGLIYGSPILKPRLFQIPRLGTLGIHHGKMPQYRGKKTTFWAMYNGDETAGVTIQLVNAGVDTGQIIQRGEVRIGRKSMGTVRRELEELGFALYVQAILDLKRGTARLVPESGPKGKLYKDPRLGDFVRFWWRQLRRRYVASR